MLARVAFVALVIAAVVLVVSRVDFRHDLHRMRVRVLSGVPDGNYHATVARLAEVAARREGGIENVASAGSAENVRLLSAAARTCEVQFGLVQDGTAWLPGLQLIARLAKPESVLFLGREGDGVHDFADLRGLRIGIGPSGSGTDAVSRALFALPELATLGVTLVNHPVDEELAMASRGEVDLAVLVIDADAPLVEEWVGKRGLQIASFASLQAVARRMPHLRAGHVGAGNYDAVRVLPRADKAVMKVETVVVGNGCAGRIATMDLLTTLTAALPDLVRHNKDTPNLTGLPLAPAATDFFANEGPHAVDEYLPWLVDLMPPANWVYIVTALSILFNAMGAGHRFRLWRIDAARVRLEGELGHVFPPATTLGDIQRTTPDPSLSTPENLAAIDRVVKELEELAARSRRYSLSMLVPMGQEMAYRYQEGVIYETLAVLRDFRRRCGACV
jgi:TRAP-type uncharacterized transport system substrate-binding protein